MSEQIEKTFAGSLCVTPEQCELMRLLFNTRIECDEDYESLGKIFDDDFDFSD